MSGAAAARRRRVAALLADGLQPEDLERARRGARQASAAELLPRLSVAQPLPGLEEGGGPGSGAADLADDAVLHVHDSDRPLPPRLAATWEEGGPLWVWRLAGGREEGAAEARWHPADLAVGIVGTRRPTLDGARQAGRIAADLARAGVEVVSGLAVGIDQAAHRGALGAGGRSAGVIGTGLGIDYPRGSADLRRRLAASGGVVTEYPTDRGVRYPQQFLARNRILAGLCDAVLVVEAGARSGALNTASWAARFGREVLVVPSSPSSPAAAGALALLRDGATPVRHAADVLESLGGPVRAAEVEARPLPDLPPAASAVLPLLSPVPSGLSELAAATGLRAQEVMVAITALEHVGLASRTGSGIVRADFGTRP